MNDNALNKELNQLNCEEIKLHISQVKIGDTIVCRDDKIRTVGKNDLKEGFCGHTLFGDSYNCGLIQVKKLKIRNK